MPRGCGVGVLAGWGCVVAGGVTVRAGAMAVSRMFHEAPRLTPKFHARFTSHQGRPGLFHARFTSHQRHGARRLRLDQEDPNWISPTARPPTNRPARPRCLTKQSRMQFPTDTDRRHLRNRMISTFRFQNLKYWQGNCMRLLLSCTRQGALHPLRSITPDQNGCNAH